MSGKVANSNSWAASFAPPVENSMLDWPEQTQTSPTATLRISKWWSPSTASVYGPGLWIGLNVTTQLPWLLAMVESDWPAMVTVTFWPGAAVPHTGSFLSRCRTMLSVNRPWRAVCWIWEWIRRRASMVGYWLLAIGCWLVAIA